MLPRDSWEYAALTMSLLANYFSSYAYSVENYTKLLGEAEASKIYNRLPDELHPYGSIDALLKAEIGETKISSIEKKIELMANGGDRKSEEFKENQPSQRRLKSYGATSDYLRARLERYHPGILAKFERGELKSIRQAAIEAGIIHPPTPLKELERAWKRASEVERHEFLTRVVGVLGVLGGQT
jgi:hypothetical protein